MAENDAKGPVTSTGGWHLGFAAWCLVLALLLVAADCDGDELTAQERCIQGRVQDALADSSKKVSAALSNEPSQDALTVLLTVSGTVDNVQVDLGACPPDAIPDDDAPDLPTLPAVPTALPEADTDGGLGVARPAGAVSSSEVAQQCPACVSLPVRLTLNWFLNEKRNGNEGSLQLGHDVTVVENLPTVGIVAAPAVVDYRLDIPTVTRSVAALAALEVAEQRISVGGDDLRVPRTVMPFRLGPVALPDVPVVRLPTLLAMWQHDSFNGPLLIALPTGSGIDTFSELDGALVNALGVLNDVNEVRSQVRADVATLTMLSGLVGTLEDLRNKAEGNNVIIVAFNEIDDLNDEEHFTLHQKGWFENDIEANDEVSSLLFISSVTGVDLFNDNDLNDAEGQLRLRPRGALYLRIPDLHRDDFSDRTEARIEPKKGGDIEVVEKPQGRRLCKGVLWCEIVDFGDEFTSLRFLP